MRKGLKEYNFHVFTLLYGDSVSNRPEQLECKRTDFSTPSVTVKTKSSELNVDLFK